MIKRIILSVFLILSLVNPGWSADGDRVIEGITADTVTAVNFVGTGTLTAGGSDIQGGQTVNITPINAPTYDLQVTDYILHVTYTTTGPVTSLTLPTAQVVNGRTIYVKDAGGNAATNSITVDTEGAETIDGAATITINSNYGGVGIYCDGSNWFVM